VHRTIGGAESVVVALKELFEVILDDGLERIGGAAVPLARSSQSRLGHEAGRRHERGERRLVERGVEPVDASVTSNARESTNQRLPRRAADADGLQGDYRMR
jgi:hypothetical protein